MSYTVTVQGLLATFNVNEKIYHADLSKHADCLTKKASDLENLQTIYETFHVENLVMRTHIFETYYDLNTVACGMCYHNSGQNCRLVYDYNGDRYAIFLNDNTTAPKPTGRIMIKPHRRRAGAITQPKYCSGTIRAFYLKYPGYYKVISARPSRPETLRTDVITSVRDGDVLMASPYAKWCIDDLESIELEYVEDDVDPVIPQTVLTQPTDQYVLHIENGKIIIKHDGNAFANAVDCIGARPSHLYTDVERNEYRACPIQANVEPFLRHLRGHPDIQITVIAPSDAYLDTIMYNTKMTIGPFYQMSQTPQDRDVCVALSGLIGVPYDDTRALYNGAEAFLEPYDDENEYDENVVPATYVCASGWYRMTTGWSSQMKGRDLRAFEYLQCGDCLTSNGVQTIERLVKDNPDVAAAKYIYNMSWNKAFV